MRIAANADVRYSFAPQFLEAAAIFARHSIQIEHEDGANASDEVQAEYRGYVVSAIMQCVAALETEIYEITIHGPGGHLGSDRTDTEARDFLRPCADLIDRQDIVSRYEMVLHLLEKPNLSRGSQPFQDTQLLIRLRNELVHYKSEWGSEMENRNFHAALRNLRHTKPPFVSELSNFFPHICLCAACAVWAVQTAVAFLDTFYDRLGVPSRLNAYRSKLKVE